MVRCGGNCTAWISNDGVWVWILRVAWWLSKCSTLLEFTPMDYRFALFSLFAVSLERNHRITQFIEKRSFTQRRNCPCCYSLPSNVCVAGT